MIARLLRPLRWAHEDGTTSTLAVGTTLQAMRPPPGWEAEARQCGHSEEHVQAQSRRAQSYGRAAVLVWHSPTGELRIAREGLDVAVDD